MITKELFGKLKDGREVFLYTLKNLQGASVKIITLGATIVSINVPDKNCHIAKDKVGNNLDSNSILWVLILWNELLKGLSNI